MAVACASTSNAVASEGLEYTTLAAAGSGLRDPIALFTTIGVAVHPQSGPALINVEWVGEIPHASSVRRIVQFPRLAKPYLLDTSPPDICNRFCKVNYGDEYGSTAVTNLDKLHYSVFPHFRSH